MKTAVLATAMAAAILCAASAASAARTVILTPPAADGSFSGTFGETGVAAGDFSDTFTFAMPTGVAGATITTNFVSDLLNNIDFSSATFNGHAFSLSPTGQVEQGYVLDVPVTGGTQMLTVNGKSGGNGSFSGTLSFALAALPEPASWAMMIVGFGGIGATLRRKRVAGPAAFGLGQAA
jgi:opacity protein-like surface antigen